MDYFRTLIRMKAGANYAMDDSDDENAVAAYQYIVQSAHNLYQPVPVQVSSREVVHRDRVAADAKMMQDYFNFGCVYGKKKFHCRFGMYRPLFLRILSKIIEVDNEFEQRPDAAGIMGHSPHMKMIAVMKCLCKGVPPDSIEDYTEMGRPTIYRYFKRFLDAVMYGFNDRYMRRPSQDDTDRLLRENAARGFPGMLGSIDCLHWQWTACPTSQAGIHYSGQKKAPTVILEAVASFDRWFWHGYFGKPGSNNDINVLHTSDVFDDVNNGVAPRCEFVVNGTMYHEGYYLADGIYPRYKVLVAAYKEYTLSRKKKLFNTYQEAKRKDVERAFGTLKRKFGILNKACMYWKKSDMKSIVRACMIMHNMVVENEFREPDWCLVEEQPTQPVTGELRMPAGALADPITWERLRLDLTKHIWERHGAGFLENEPIVIDNPNEVYTDSDAVDQENDAYPPKELGEEYGNFFEDGE